MNLADLKARDVDSYRDRLAHGDLTDVMPPEDQSDLLTRLVEIITDPKRDADVIAADCRAEVWRVINHHAGVEADDWEPR